MIQSHEECLQAIHKLEVKAGLNPPERKNNTDNILWRDFDAADPIQPGQTFEQALAEEDEEWDSHGFPILDSHG